MLGERGSGCGRGRVRQNPRTGTQGSRGPGRRAPRGRAYWSRPRLDVPLPRGRRWRVAGDDSRFSFAVVGDSGSGGKGQLAVAALLERLRPDLVLHTGDVVYPAGHERHYDRRFFAPYRNLIKTVPLFPVLGNHDVRKGNGAAF